MYSSDHLPNDLNVHVFRVSETPIAGVQHPHSLIKLRLDVSWAQTKRVVVPQTIRLHGRAAPTLL